MDKHNDMNDILEDRCNEIKNEITALKIKKDKRSEEYSVLILIGIGIICCTVCFIKNLFLDPAKAFVQLILLFTPLYLFIMLKYSIYSKKQRIDMEIASLQEELDILENEKLSYKIMADRKFKLHQDSLKRYYDINISQLKNMYHLGCISLGMGVFLICLILALSFTNEIDTVTIIGGIISSIVINFIGALAIKMFSDTNKYSIEFHNKMAKTNNLLLSETLIAKITDKELQEKTLAEVAKAIVENDK